MKMKSLWGRDGIGEKERSAGAERKKGGGVGWGWGEKKANNSDTLPGEELLEDDFGKI